MRVQHLPLSLLMLFCFLVGVVRGQKHDYIWISGYQSMVPTGDSTFGFTVLDFNEEPRSVQYNDDINLNIGSSNSMMCDEDGNLLFYTNGVFICNFNHDTINPGSGLNYISRIDAERRLGQNINQGIISIPFPGHLNEYFLFHMEKDITSEIGVHVDVLRYSLVDMNMNQGRGGMALENEVMLRDTFRTGNIQAVKHANGQDWWVVLPERNSNRMFQMLLTPDGIVQQAYVPLPDTLFDGLGQSVFTPDGSKYVSYDNYWTGAANHSHLDIMDFDRCTGSFSNFNRILRLNTQPCYGVSVSPNSRFAYLFNATHVYQVDLWEPIDEDNYLVVAEYDGYRSPFSTVFNTGQLAPDGKIYMSSCNGVNVYHVIEYPDLKGEDCFVNQHSLFLFTYNQTSVPNFPNYRLGALEGSPCDSLTSTSTTFNESKPSIFPNPTSDILTLDLPELWKDKSVIYSIQNAQGQLVVVSKELRNQQVDVSGLSPGAYYISLVMDRNEDTPVVLSFVRMD